MDKPQSAIEAVVQDKLPGRCSKNPEAGEGDASYRLKLTGGKFAPNTVALAVINHAGSIAARRGVVSSDLDGDGRREFFRTCASNEGLHLTVWSGRPLAGRRRWHRYFYLGYDLVPNCKEADYAGTQ